MRKVLSLMLIVALSLTISVPLTFGDTIDNEADYLINDGDMIIKRVEVLFGGPDQAGYRNQEYTAYTSTVYKGDHPTLAVNGEDPDKYYTTKRAASMTDLTGLIPSLPQSEEEEEAYGDIFSLPGDELSENS